MANTITNVTAATAEATSDAYIGEGAFTKLFDPIYVYEGTITDQNAVALTTIGEYDITLTGVALGDIVLGVSINAAYDDGTDQATVSAHVSAANTVTLQISADDAEFAADTFNSKTVKLLVGRPAW